MDYQSGTIDGSVHEDYADGGIPESFPMRVVLIPQTGVMRTLWLPSHVEGRYLFLDSTGSDDGLPFYIEAVSGKWIANSGKTAVFLQAKVPGQYGDPIHELELGDKRLANLEYNKSRYALYAEVERPGDYVFLPYYLEERTEYIIGRQEGSDICYPNLMVSRLHAVLRWNGSAWEIIDRNSSNGVFVNGRQVKHAVLRVGDCVFIMGLYILMGAGFISINNANGRVTLNTLKIRRITGKGDVFYPEVRADYTDTALFDRQPRRQVKVNPEPISIEMPPMPISKNKIPLMLRMGSPMLMGGQALMNGNLIMAMTSMVFPTLTQGLTEKDRKEYEAKRLERYREYLDAKEDEILAEKAREEKLLRQNNPELSSVLQFAVNKDRLWERRKGDDDFLSIRVGFGQIPMIAKRSYNPRRFQLEPDILVEEMYALAERSVTLDNAPVLLSLTQDYIVGILGEKSRCMALIRNLILQIAVTHSYDEVKLVLLMDREDTSKLGFIRYLPHCWNEDRSVRFFAVSRPDAQQLTKYLSQEFKDMLDSRNNSNKNYLKHKASYVVMALSKKLFDCVEILKDVLDQDNYYGISVITAFDSSPKECSKLIDLRGQENKLISLNGSDGDDQGFTPDTCDKQLALAGVRELMQTKLKMDSKLYTLPNMITFLEMYHAGRVEHLNPIKRWADNNPVKSLAAPIGVGTDAALFTLDLHEKRQGPHGLVAGMTGSGKSEFIITYILSMAINYSPDEVAFILIDYKGGGLADAFENKERGIHLPHLVGTITNLDGAAIQRSLKSINSELTRRQTVFKKTKSEVNEGTMDIYDYQRLYRSGKVSEPMPHLFIISDEFAELKKQQPEFMDELISAARIGRSLGVHLILATQKPGGVVNDQIWSNTKFRVCLRVQDRGDSMEMLKRPEAAELKNTGRFYLQVGYNEFFAMGQSAWCGAGYTPQDEIQTKEDDAVVFIDSIGQTVLEAKPKVEKRAAESKEIVAIVRYLSDLAKREGLQPRNLWLEPLPERMELRALMEKWERPAQCGISALIGMADDPERQTQFPLCVDLQSARNMLVCGSGGSGKSTFLCTMLYTLVSAYSPADLNYYIVDLSGGVLHPFSRMPHCGAYLTQANENDFDRLLSLISELVSERKKRFAEAEVFSYDAYRRIKPLPLVLLIIDGFTNITNFRRGNDYYSGIHAYMRDASNYGIRFILTCNHMNEVSAKSKQELDFRIALQAKDKYEYGDILEAKCSATPPVRKGRGLCLVDGRILEYHTAVLDCMDSDQERSALLRRSLKEIAGGFQGVAPAKSLPMADSEQEYASFIEDIPPERIPLGYSVKDMKKVSIPLQQLYDMSLYFGNPAGVAPVLANLASAAERDAMELIVMRRLADTVFDQNFERKLRLHYTGRLTILNTVQEDLAKLDDRMIEEITARNVYRDLYCARNGIPDTDKARAKKAAKLIRANSKPLLVLFESFGDLCRLEKTKELTGEFSAFFERLRGYNIYFCGCFYPAEEGNLGSSPLMRSFNKDELLLLFGGRYDKQCMTSLPMDIRSFEQVNPKYDRFMLKYRGEYHPMIMPCGKLDSGTGDPDEEAII